MHLLDTDIHLGIPQIDDQPEALCQQAFTLCGGKAAGSVDRKKKPCRTCPPPRIGFPPKSREFESVGEEAASGHGVDAERSIKIISCGSLQDQIDALPKP